MIIAVLLLCGNIWLYKKRKNIHTAGLNSYIEACCVWMLFLFLLTEGLSVFYAVRFLTLFAAWGAFDLLLLVLLLFQWKRGGGMSMSKRDKSSGDGQGAVGLRALAELVKANLRTGLSNLRACPYYIIIGLAGLAVFLLALVTTPNNWDSMTYHLSRIAAWTQNRSVAHYATNCLREIASPVLAEFVNLHVYILCRGSDQFVNLLQAVSYLTCAYVVGAIAKRLGCNRLFCFLAMLLYLSMPIAFAEGTTTQVDNFASVWLLFYVYVLLDLVEIPEGSRRETASEAALADGKSDHLTTSAVNITRVCVLGLCVAFGYLTKPSVCFGMVVFALWLLIVCLKRKDKVSDLVKLVLCALPCVVLPLIPETLRNFKTFHSYASSFTGARQLVGTYKPNYVFVNFVKNFTFNMPISLLKDSEVFFAKFAVKAAKILQVELDAKSISEDGREFSLHEAQTYGYDTAINPIVLWAFIFCVIWLIIRIRKTDWKALANRYLLCAGIAFCVFCAVLRWEPFVTRYMVSYLALLCPAIAAWIWSCTGGDLRAAQAAGSQSASSTGNTGAADVRNLKLRCGIVGALTLLCVMELLNLTKYHLDIYRYNGANNRPYGYFASRREETQYYADAADAVKSADYQTVGLYVVKGDAYQYPVWAMLGDRHLEHVNVSNDSSIYADPDFTPDCILWFASLPEEDFEINGRVYNKVTDFGEKHYLLEAE
jgi:hypothetical protein